VNRRTLVTVLLVLGVVALFAVPLALDRGRSQARTATPAAPASPDEP